MSFMCELFDFLLILLAVEQPKSICFGLKQFGMPFAILNVAKRSEGSPYTRGDF